MKEQVRLMLMQFQLETNRIMKKYTPDALGSDAYKAEMLALLDNTAKEITELFD